MAFPLIGGYPPWRRKALTFFGVQETMWMGEISHPKITHSLRHPLLSTGSGWWVTVDKLHSLRRLGRRTPAIYLSA